MQKSKSHNVPLLCAVTFLQGMVFYAAVATLYRQAAGLSVFQITFLEGVSTALALALEIPWGRLADRLGYKTTMVVCNVLFFLSKIIFWRAQGFGAFLAERLLLAAVISGLSGVDASMLYLSAPRSEAQRSAGWYTASGEAGLLLGAICYSLFFSGRYRPAAFATVITYGLAAILTLFLTEVRPRQTKQKRPAFLPLLKEQLRAPGMIPLVLCGALFSEAVHCITVYFSQLQYIRCGLDQTIIGLAFALTAVAGLAGPLSHRLTGRFGRRRAGGTMLMLSMVCAGGLAWTRLGVLSVVLVAFLSLLAALFQPLIATVENERINSPDRATALSVNAMLADAVIILADLLLGRAADVSLPLALALCAFCCALSFILFKLVRAD